MNTNTLKGKYFTTRLGINSKMKQVNIHQFILAKLIQTQLLFLQGQGLFLYLYSKAPIQKGTIHSFL
jgi:hypothetical protein